MARRGAGLTLTLRTFKRVCPTAPDTSERQNAVGRLRQMGVWRSHDLVQRLMMTLRMRVGCTLPCGRPPPASALVIVMPVVLLPVDDAPVETEPAEPPGCNTLIGIGAV